MEINWQSLHYLYNENKDVVDINDDAGNNDDNDDDYDDIDDDGDDNSAKGEISKTSLSLSTSWLVPLHYHHRCHHNNYHHSISSFALSTFSHKKSLNFLFCGIYLSS